MHHGGKYGILANFGAWDDDDDQNESDGYHDVGDDEESSCVSKQLRSLW